MSLTTMDRKATTDFLLDEKLTEANLKVQSISIAVLESLILRHPPLPVPLLGVLPV